MHRIFSKFVQEKNIHGLKLVHAGLNREEGLDGAAHIGPTGRLGDVEALGLGEEAG